VRGNRTAEARSAPRRARFARLSLRIRVSDARL